uniref:Putative 8.9 kDa family member n=1 Tax=Rhipicephalus pulchellus TaxID=72859 RepID=L7M931_RHIPC
MSPKQLILLLAACSRLSLSDAAGCFNPVPLWKGAACLHKDIRVPLTESVNLRAPCQSWTCVRLNATHGDLLVIKCVKVAARPPYVVQPGGNGVFPDCCPKPRRDPQYDGHWIR